MYAASVGLVFVMIGLICMVIIAAGTLQVIFALAFAAVLVSFLAITAALE